jgi:adenine-specific DNA-methyltransferase
MIGGNLNEELSVDKIREYVWYMETRGMGNGNGELGMGNGDDPYLLGVANDTAYYFCYEKSKAVTLDRTLLKKLKTKAGRSGWAISAIFSVPVSVIGKPM